MAHMAHAETCEDEQTSDEDETISRNGSGRLLMNTDEYIESLPRDIRRLLDTSNLQAEVVGPHSSEETESESEITIATESSAREKGKRKGGERLEWSDDEDPYSKFKNRKKVARKKVAATKKKTNEKARGAALGRQKARNLSGKKRPGQTILNMI